MKPLSLCLFLAAALTAAAQPTKSQLACDEYAKSSVPVAPGPLGMPDVHGHGVQLKIYADCLERQDQKLRRLADKPPVPTPVLPEIAVAPTIDEPRSVTMTETSVEVIHVCQLQNTVMVLDTDELARNAFVSDKKNWVIATTSSTEATRFLSIKVEKPETRETTLNLVTNRNTSYTFRLVVGSDHCDSKVFIQPDNSLKKQIAETKPWAPPEVVEHLQAQIADAAAESAKARVKADQSVEAFRASYPAKLRFDYKFDPKIAGKMGIKEIFHDGKFTYVSADSQEAPALYELKEGKPSLIAFSVKDGLYTTNKIVEAGYLAVGGTGNGKHQEKLAFKRVAAAEEN